MFGWMQNLRYSHQRIYIKPLLKTPIISWSVKNEKCKTQTNKKNTLWKKVVLGQPSHEYEHNHLEKYRQFSVAFEYQNSKNENEWLLLMCKTLGEAKFWFHAIGVLSHAELQKIIFVLDKKNFFWTPKIVQSSPKQNLKTQNLR